MTTFATRLRRAGALTRFRRPADTGCYVDFAFCPNCGSTMFWELEAWPDRIGIPAGVFADPAFPPPSVSIFSPRKHPWVSVPPGIPENEGHSAAFLAAASAALAKRGASAM